MNALPMPDRQPDTPEAVIKQIWKNPCPACGAQSMEDSEIRCQTGYVCLASEQRALEDQT